MRRCTGQTWCNIIPITMHKSPCPHGYLVCPSAVIFNQNSHNSMMKYNDIFWPKHSLSQENAPSQDIVIEVGTRGTLQHFLFLSLRAGKNCSNWSVTLSLHVIFHGTSMKVYRHVYTCLVANQRTCLQCTQLPFHRVTLFYQVYVLPYISHGETQSNSADAL